MAKREEAVLCNERLKYILCGTDWDKRFISVVNPILKIFHIDAVIRDSFYKNQWNNTIIKGKPLLLFTTFSGNIYKGLETIFEASNLLVKKNLVKFEWNIDEKSDVTYPEGEQFGVIAQEVEKIFPELVNKDSEGKLAVAYANFTPILIEAIKEQQKMIEELQERLAVLEKDNE